MTAPPLGLIEGGGTGRELIRAVRTCSAALGDRGDAPIELIRFDDDRWREEIEEERFHDGLHEALGAFLEEVRGRGGAVVRGSLPAPILYRLRHELGPIAHVVPLNPYPELSRFPELRTVVVRDGSQGLYHASTVERRGGTVVATAEWREESLRFLAETSFALAEEHPRRRLTSILKTSVLGPLGELWLSVFEEAARAHPEVRYEHRPSGAGFSDMWLERDEFGVVATDDEAGDVLADLVPSVLYESRNLVPAANLSPGGHATYQTDHGTIRPLAGKDRVNPLAMLAALAMALERTLRRGDDAAALRGAIRAALEDGLRTDDLRREPGHVAVGTRGMTEAIVRHLSRTAARASSA